MKIISNYKDYYDYLTGIYGIDNKVVYERKYNHSINFYNNTIYTYYILDKRYVGFFFQDKWWYSKEHFEELVEKYKNKELDKYLTKTNRGNASLILKSNIQEIKSYIYYLNNPKKFDYRIQNYQKSIKHNSELNVPVLQVNINNFEYNPPLKDSFIPKVLDAKELYLGLVEFLSYKEPIIENKPTDMLRFESKGFDKKKSFRKIK